MSEREQALRTALEEIVNPVRALRERTPAGYEFDARVALELANNPEYLRGIARAALEASSDD